MSGQSVLSVVVQVIRILENLSIPYHLGGSFASTIHGVPRQTHDVDMVVDLPQAAGRQLVRALADDFYISESAVEAAISRRSCFNAIHLASGFKVDFFVKGHHQYDDVELGRSVTQLIVANPPKSAEVKSAEDVVLRKLQWFKDGGGISDRQWKDVLGVLKAQEGRLDMLYLNEWARRLGIFDLLEKALSET